ncbi:hypothetical protein IJG89_03605 [Candidatus Saccharibacteria bacterium]|nr:hypothetical protein [Candidatus Saccharibacteria bacterium]
MKKGDKKKIGFTVIEVSLVIAIAGLIFMMVFVALPGLRATQRDTERREDMMELVAAIKKFQQNNRGALPATNSKWQSFFKDYQGNIHTDPIGEDYKLAVKNCSGTTVGEECESTKDFEEKLFPNDYTITVVTQASCSGQKAIASSNPRKVAVLYVLESGGIYCGNT